MRAILSAPALAPSALAELKDWLGLTTASEDAALTALLRAALESCEAFTGTMPITCACEEILPIASGWQRLVTRPVIVITDVEALALDGARVPLALADYALEIGADGAGLVRIMSPGSAQRIAVRFTAGLAADWNSLPDGLRHGIVRLAAHHYRQRESDGADLHPPASVAALWRPWRSLRLA